MMPLLSNECVLYFRVAARARTVCSQHVALALRRLVPIGHA